MNFLRTLVWVQRVCERTISQGMSLITSILEESHRGIYLRSSNDDWALGNKIPIDIDTNSYRDFRKITKKTQLIRRVRCKPGSVLDRNQGQLSISNGCYQSPLAVLLKRDREKTNL